MRKAILRLGVFAIWLLYGGYALATAIVLATIITVVVMMVATTVCTVYDLRPNYREMAVLVGIFAMATSLTLTVITTIKGQLKVLSRRKQQETERSDPERPEHSPEASQSPKKRV